LQSAFDHSDWINSEPGAARPDPGDGVRGGRDAADVGGGPLTHHSGGGVEGGPSGRVPHRGTISGRGEGVGPTGRGTPISWPGPGSGSRGRRCVSPPPRAGPAPPPHDVIIRRPPPPPRDSLWPPAQPRLGEGEHRLTVRESMIFRTLQELLFSVFIIYRKLVLSPKKIHLPHKKAPHVHSHSGKPVIRISLHFSGAILNLFDLLRHRLLVNPGGVEPTHRRTKNKGQ